MQQGFFSSFLSVIPAGNLLFRLTRSIFCTPRTPMLEGQKQIPCGNDRKKGKDETRRADLREYSYPCGNRGGADYKFRLDANVFRWGGLVADQLQSKSPGLLAKHSR